MLSVVEVAVQSLGDALGRPPRILLAEDDDELRWALANALGRSGFVVEQVTTSFGLIDRFAEAVVGPDSAPDAVVSDVRMPGYSAVDVISDLRDAGWRTPVVFISGFDDAMGEKSLMDIEHAALLRKPVTLERLVETVEQFIWADLAERS